jgi:hypothetical protein
MKSQMEQWEIDLRKKLEDELPHGSYHIPGPPDVFTGKGGYIEFLVEFEREARKWCKDVNPVRLAHDIKDATESKEIKLLKAEINKMFPVSGKI